MIFNDTTNAKVITDRYRRTLAEAAINRDRVSPAQADWLDIPPSVGTGKYDDNARGWMVTTSWEGDEVRFTPRDFPVTKGGV